MPPAKSSQQKHCGKHHQQDAQEYSCIAFEVWRRDEREGCDWFPRNGGLNIRRGRGRRWIHGGLLSRPVFDQRLLFGRQTYKLETAME
jgi:hypothetical protein